MTAATPAFAGSIPQNYHNQLGPLLFEPYAKDMETRLSQNLDRQRCSRKRANP